MKTHNLCEHCNEYHGLEVWDCGTCRQPLVRDAKGAVSVWRLGAIEDGLLGPILAGVREAFGRPVVLQPAYLREDPSDRSRQGWNGRSAGVFLDQVNQRQEAFPGTWLSLGITEENIVPSGDYNFLFGYAHEGAAVLSLEPLRRDRPAHALLVRRAVQIAVHELGHGLGLDHHGYDEGIACVMAGDVEEDSLETIDEGTSAFCRACRRQAGLRR